VPPIRELGGGEDHVAHFEMHGTVRSWAADSRSVRDTFHCNLQAPSKTGEVSSILAPTLAQQVGMDGQKSLGEGGI